jgi:hypothetical protein
MCGGNRIEEALRRVHATGPKACGCRFAEARACVAEWVVCREETEVGAFGGRMELAETSTFPKELRTK